MAEVIVSPTAKETIVTLGDGTVVSATISQETLSVISEKGDPIVLDLNTGPRGQPGSAILVGNSFPLMSQGSVGDIFLSVGGVNVGAVYKKTESAWVEEGNVRGPAGGVETVNGDAGPGVILDKSDIGLDEVDNTADVDKPVSTAQAAAIALKANASDTVNLTGAQTIAGTKTFSAAPVVPDGSWTIAKTSGLQDALNAGSSNSVALTGAQTITGSKTFSTEIIGAASGNVLKVGDDARIADVNVAHVIGIVSQADVTRGGIVFGNATGNARIEGSGTAMTITAASLTFTGTLVGSGASLTGLTKTQVGLANVDNTSDANKPVSTAQQTALNLKANLASPTFTGTVAGITAAMVGLGNVRNVDQVDLTSAQTIAGVKTFSSSPIVPTPTTDTQASTKKYVDDAIAILTNGAPALLNTIDELAAALGDDANFATTVTNSLATKAPLASPTFTGTVSGITKAMVGLANVDNTSDANKPISTAEQAALNLKANLASPTFTGTVSGITAAMVGLGNVNNTSDAAKPVSTAQQTALDLKANLASPTFTGTVTAPTFSGSGASLTNLAAANLTGTILQARMVPNIQRFEHGSNAATARPTGSTYIEWVGSVLPTNMITGDTWINTSANGNQNDLFPAGMVVATASTKPAAPSPWYFIEGQQVLISSDTALYNELTNNGTVFPYGANTNGSGAAGTTHFRLPDSRGRVIVHADGTTEFAAAGTVGGVKSVTLTITQVPNVQGTIDAHAGRSGWWTPTGAFSGSSTTQAYGDPALTSTGATSVSQIRFNNGGGGQAHTNLQPFLTLRYMIKR